MLLQVARPQAGTLALGLGREEGLEDARLHLVGHAGARIPDGEEHVFAWRTPGWALQPSAMVALQVSMVMTPPPGMASRALTVKFMSTCSIWCDIGLDAAELRFREGNEIDILTDETAQHPVDIRNDVAQNRLRAGGASGCC